MDGGYAWVIVVACFFNLLLTDGVAYSFGLLFIPLLEYFNVSLLAASAIGPLMIAVELMSGESIQYLLSGPSLV